MEIVVHDNTLKTVAIINNDIPMLPSFSMIIGIGIKTKEQKHLYLL